MIGIQAGVECLRKSYNAEEQATVSARRVFLFSDGLVNSGVTDKSQILANIEG